MRTRSTVTDVVFLLPQRLCLLDLAGPAEVFRTAVDHGLPYRLSFVAAVPNPVTADGLAVHAETTWPALTSADVVVVPGSSPGSAVAPETVDAVRLHSGTVVGVGAGVDVLGRAGLLDGKRCTTHPLLRQDLANRCPKASVVDDVLHVVDGRVATAASAAAGIDLALHLIAAAHGPGAAARIARAMVVYPRDNGDDRLDSVLLRHRGHVDDLAHRLQDLIEDRFTQRLRLVDMSRELGFSERTLTRHFRRATGLTPLRYQQLLRLERAEHLLGRGATAEAAARAVGLTDARALRALRG
ncbi:GlxA family transcriptional regulator [Umezawaea sp. NPDC059074]|uniref:GlxA family transcriptional regulator n=1 Tax=Umezawaea sp. NPDC059074 TaxID=3346716 RepID=UPI00369D5746